LAHCEFRDQDVNHFYAIDPLDNTRHWRTTQENASGFRMKSIYQINAFLVIVKSVAVHARNNQNC